MNRLLFTPIVLVLMALPAVALKCYVCGGDEDACKKSKLEDNKATYLKTCLLGDKCFRTWEKLKDNDVTVSSGCGYQSTCDTLKSVCDKAKDTLKDYHCAVGCCSSDGCNAGTSFTCNIILLAVCFLVSLELLK
ncbi:uncharacterized protein LOC111346974 [Stylophora pistillata]|uniref:uncharacterized protein LOC111346974 n=1 Tax=Stylophora pistillata TaxID=50429 RepID=UPI000C0460FC|nr:uncharacterized protein LOC111346974 [Stylophora pistillata]